MMPRTPPQVPLDDRDELRLPAVCGATIEGPEAHGSSRGIRTWRRRCQARPMRDRGVEGFVPGRCFQHQPSEVRNAVYAAAKQASRRAADA